MFKMSVDITFVRFTFLTLMLNDFLIGESFRLYLIVVLFFQLMHMCMYIYGYNTDKRLPALFGFKVSLQNKSTFIVYFYKRDNDDDSLRVVTS